MWAFSKNHTPEEIAAILKISSHSVRIWSIAVKKVENAKMNHDGVPLRHAGN